MVPRLRATILRLQVEMGISPKSDPLDLVLKGHSFSPGLARQLEEVEDAEARDKVGWLDWDPVLNSQDPADKYATGRVTLSGDRYFVEVRPAGDARNRDIVAELVFQSGTRVFVDSLPELLRVSAT